MTASINKGIHRHLMQSFRRCKVPLKLEMDPVDIPCRLLRDDKTLSASSCSVGKSAATTHPLKNAWAYCTSHDQLIQ